MRCIYINTHAYYDRKLTKKKEREREGMNVLEFVSITCQAVNLSACMDCFRLSLELHPSHIVIYTYIYIYMYIYMNVRLCKEEMIDKQLKCSEQLTICPIS